MRVSVSTKNAYRIKTLVGAVDNVLSRETNPEELQTFLNKYLLPSLVRSSIAEEKDELLDQMSRIYRRIEELSQEQVFHRT